MKKNQKNLSSALYPNPVVLVSSKNKKEESIITLAWVGTLCSDPPTIGISLTKSRYSYELIKKSKEFIVNIPTKSMKDEVQLCGTKSGREIDKWQECKFSRIKGKKVDAYYIDECPVNIECKVKQVIEIGLHDLFIGEVVDVHIDEKWKNNNYPDMLVYVRGIYKKCVDIG